MGGVKVMAFALFIAVRATSQNAPSVLPSPPNEFPNPVPGFPYTVSVPYSVPQKASNLFSPVPQMPHPVFHDPSKLFPYAVPQEGTVNPPAQVQCKFSHGKTIIVDYSTRHVKNHDFFWTFIPPAPWATVFNGVRFTTDASLVTVRGITVSAGAYKIVVPDRYTWPLHRQPLLVMQKDNGDELSVPISYTELASRDEIISPISFERTDESCIMRVYQKDSNAQASLEFRANGAVLSVTH
jgi:hypothetical protein